MNNNKYDNIGAGRMFCDMPDWINRYENEFQSDCSRLIFSPSFRRLQGKTQLYPNGEYDYFRSRLTHSLEVNEIAQCIGTHINGILNDKREVNGFSISPDVLRFACYAHDLGHPPFGHDGEDQLNRCMSKAGGFNGNSQTFRLLTKIEKGCINMSDRTRFEGGRTGLNITFRSLASVLKHIDETPDEKKGYYQSEAGIVSRIFQELNHDPARTIECQIMDIADDISNAVHDLDDSLKSSLLNPFDLFMPQEDILKNVVMDVFNKSDESCTDEIMRECFKKIYCQLNFIFEESGFINMALPKEKDIVAVISPIYKGLRNLSSDGAKRTLFINNLKNKYINSLDVEYDESAPLFSRIIFKSNSETGDNPELQIRILKSFHRHYQCKSSYITAREYRGKYIVRNIFRAVRKDPRLMPDDYYFWYMSYKDIKPNDTRDALQKRCICDFISGMTDRYCLEYYGRLYSESPQSIFKPL